MSEHKGAVTFLGKPLTLLGTMPDVGQKAPDARVVDGDLATVNLSDFSNKVRVLITVPSLDTPVCDLETRKFNKYAGEFARDVAVVVVSMDLPFAQKRWCGAADIKNVTVLSDYREAAVGASYGVLIKELRLLARAVYVVDRTGVIRYAQLVKEIAHEPNYDEVRASVNKLLLPT